MQNNFAVMPMLTFEWVTGYCNLPKLTHKLTNYHSSEFSDKNLGLKSRNTAMENWRWNISIPWEINTTEFVLVEFKTVHVPFGKRMIETIKQITKYKKRKKWNGKRTKPTKKS